MLPLFFKWEVSLFSKEGQRKYSFQKAKNKCINSNERVFHCIYIIKCIFGHFKNRRKKKGGNILGKEMLHGEIYNIPVRKKVSNNWSDN